LVGWPRRTRPKCAGECPLCGPTACGADALLLLSRKDQGTLRRQVIVGHHFSTELARNHPPLDLTDVYAFESHLPGKTCLVLILNPKSKAGDLSNFSPEAIYKLHLGANKKHSEGRTYSVRFKSGVATLGLLGLFCRVSASHNAH
jgi:Domain of unknown function (DUF4331)